MTHARSLTYTHTKAVIQRAFHRERAVVFWQVGSSAVFGTNSASKGTVMADQAITLPTGASLGGRVLARIGWITLDSNAIVRP